MKTTLRFFAAVFLAGGILLSSACGGGDSGGFDITQQPFTREREDGKIPVKPELIRQQVRAVWDGTPEGEAEVLRWQQIETDYHACRLASDKTKKTTEKVFADCMAQRGYVYMYRIDAEQLHNDIEFELNKKRDGLSDAERKAEDERIAAARKAEEDRRAAERKAEEDRIAAAKKRQEESERIRRQKELGGALVAVLNAAPNVNIAEVKHLIDDGADVNTKGKDGWTALHFAAREGQTETALAFIKAGADIEAKDNNGWTPLHYATGQVKIKTALALIKAGANIEARDKKDWTPLHWAAGKGQTQIVHLLIKAGADVNAKGIDDWVPLHYAAFFGQNKAALALIKAGAYLNAITNRGDTPLDIARSEKQWSVINILQNPPPPKPSGEQAPNVAIAPAPEDSNVAEHVFEKGWRSVVYIETRSSQGGGVIIRPNIVATNCHVVDSGGIFVYKSQNRRADKRKGYRATIRRRDDKRDFCLLDVSGLWGVPANVRRYDTLGIGESVFGIGAPQGLDLSLTSGLISQKRRADGVRYIQTDAAISPGSSGGGLFDRKGNLVGIMTSKFVDEEVEGIGFAIPADLALSSANR